MPVSKFPAAMPLVSPVPDEASQRAKTTKLRFVPRVMILVPLLAESSCTEEEALNAISALVEMPVVCPKNVLLEFSPRRDRVTFLPNSGESRHS